MMYANEDWEGIIEQAQRQGSARGLPKPPAGLRADGGYALNRTKLGDGGAKRTLYYGVKGDWTTVGWWTEGAQETPAPQVNGTGPKPARSGPSRDAGKDRPEQGEPVAIDGPEPLIMLTPVAGGAWRLNGYGVELAEVIRALRLSLVHLVARQAGVVIIDELVAPEMAVVAERLPRLPQPRNDKRKRPGGGKMRTTVRYPDEFDEELEEEYGG